MYDAKRIALHSKIEKKEAKRHTYLESLRQQQKEEKELCHTGDMPLWKGWKGASDRTFPGEEPIIID